MKPPLSYIPALPVVTGLGAGILFAVYCTAAAWILAAVSITAGLWMWYKQLNLASALAIFFAVGIAMTVLRLPEPLNASIDGRKCNIVGTVTKVTETNETMRYVLEVSEYDNAPCKFKILLTVYTVEQAFARGDVIKVQGKLCSNEQHLDVPDQTDYSAYTFIDGITGKMGVQPTAVKFIKSNPTFAQRLYNRGSATLENSIVKSGFDGATAAFLLATIAGDDLLLPEHLNDNFRAIGLAHVLALSGLHVGIIMALIAMLLFAVRCLPAGRYIYYLMLAGAVLCYACITGMAPSVARAAVMVLVFVATKLSERTMSAYNSVCVAVSIWLFINPFWLWSPGLQLSVAAVIAIVWLANVFNPYDHTQPTKRYLVALITIPVAAIIGTSMLTLCYFHNFPLWFLPSNIVAAVLAPLIIGGGAIATTLTAVGISPGYMPDVVNALYACLDAVVQWFAQLPGGQLTNIYPEWWQILLYAVCIAILAVATYKHRRAYYYICAMLTVLLIVSFTIKKNYPGDELFVPRIAASTDILIRHNDRALLVTNGGTVALDRAKQLYADYLGRRSASIALAPDSFDISTFARRKNYLFFADKTMKIVTSDRDAIPPTDSIDYALVGGGFKGDIVQLAHTLKARKIILAQSLNATRRHRYAAELTSASIPHTLNTPFTYTP